MNTEKLDKLNAAMQANAAEMISTLAAELKGQNIDLIYTDVEHRIPYYVYDKFMGTLTEKTLVAIKVINENKLQVAAVNTEIEKAPTKEQLEKYTRWIDLDPYGSWGILNAFNLSYLFDYIDIAEIA